MSKLNYYQILGVPYNADESTIKKAYRALAKKYHPDSNSKDKEKFSRIAEAYQVLIDSELRSQYHYMGHDTFTKNYRRNSNLYRGNAASSHGNDHKNEKSCGSCQDCGDGHSQDHEHNTADGHCGACEQGRKEPNDQKEKEIPPFSIRVAVRLTMEETLREVIKEIEVHYKEECPHCHGAGREPGTDLKICPDCLGEGTRMSFTSGVHNSEAWEQTCSTCKGYGEVPRTPCISCKGSGVVHLTRRVKVKIPAKTYPGRFFVFDDVVIKETFDKKLDNLYVIILVDDHQDFESRDYHLFSKMPISFAKITLGGKLKIRTLEGTETYELQPGTEAGGRIRMDGHGLPEPQKVGGGRGDLYVTLEVEIPKGLTSKQEKALRLFQQSMEEENL